MKTHLVRQLFIFSILGLGACSSNPKVIPAPVPAVASGTSVQSLPPGATGVNLFTPAPTYNGNATINPISTDPNQASCLSSSYSDACTPKGISRFDFLDAGVQTYGYLDACLQLVLAQKPQSDSVASQAHIAGRIALVRCYQQIIQSMQQVQPWGGPQLSLFDQQNDLLSTLIVLLSK